MSRDRLRDEVGEQLVREVQEEIERCNLGDALAARYVSELRVVRVERADVTSNGGIDYPVNLGLAPIKEHLQLYIRFKEAWG